MNQRNVRLEEKLFFIVDQSLFSLMSNDEDGISDQIVRAEPSEDKVKLTTKQQGEMIRARAFLHRLDKKVEEKDQIVKQIRFDLSCFIGISMFFFFHRESIYFTKEKIIKLEHNRSRLENEIDRAKDLQNV